VAIWGWAEPGTEVTVRFANQSQKATAGPDGKWRASLKALAASSKGRTLTVETNQPELSAKAHDILVGDVWLCSGQSNMEMGIGACNEEEEIARANYPRIRLLTVKKDTAFKPQQTIAAEWKPCSPETLREGGWGGFSATAYFFGKKIHEELDVPIGLIHSSWGGTFAESRVSQRMVRKT
jgi:sialate O-acetylesterase